MAFLQLLVISAVFYGATAAPAAGDCPGGYKNGEVIERGRYFYECRGGDIVPKGCLGDEQRRLDVGATVDRKQYRLECKLDSSGYLSLSPKACLHQNQEHAVDSDWQDENNFYSCKKDGEGLRVSTDGCVSEGKRVNLNDKVPAGDAVLLCNRTANNGSRLVTGGCAKDGKQYNIGESFDNGKFWFNCTRFGARPAGCINAGQRLNDGERFFNNDVIYECIIDSDKQDVRVAGCIQNNGGATIERRLGCYWVEGPEPQQFEWNCKHDKAANTATRVKVRCNYREGKGVHNIDPGCYRVINKSIVGCVKDSAGEAAYKTFTGEDVSQATAAGLKEC